MSDSRPSFDATWMNVAYVVAQRSRCVRDQVGAVIVDSENRIIDTGYNGPPRNFNAIHTRCDAWCRRAQGAPAPNYSDCVSLHAEQNALMFSDRRMRVGGTIYVTSNVCSVCAKLIANSGLIRVVMHDIGPKALHRNGQQWVDFMRECELIVEVL